MDEPTRRQYLKAMGVEVWLPRSSGAIADGLPASQHNEINDQADANPLFDPETKIPEETGAELATWDQLQQEVADCQRCALCATRTRTVFGSGSQHADWMLIGEAPGQNEDREGLPFVGKAGLLLTEMLRAVGLKRDQVFIANIIKCRPPENRNPKKDEAAACAEYLQRQLDIIQPKIILALGRVAAQNLLKTEQTIGKLRGTVHYLDKTPVVVIYHPAYLLRSLLEKRKAWADLQMAMQVFQNLEKK